MMRKIITLLTAGLLACAGLFAQTSGTHLLDSIITVDASGNKREKTEYAYDSKGNKTLEARYFFWDSNVNDWKYEYTYDTNGNLMMSFDYDWDSNLNDWVSKSKNEYIYYANGNSMRLTYDWDNNLNDWSTSPISKEETVYYVDGNSTRWGYKWDSDLNDWKTLSNNGFAYDTNGNIVSHVIYKWDRYHWIENFKFDYSYDTFGNLTFIIGTATT